MLTTSGTETSSPNPTPSSLLATQLPMPLYQDSHAISTNRDVLEGKIVVHCSDGVADGDVRWIDESIGLVRPQLNMNCD